ncbi:uncharacterized protein LOC111275436 [Durio zibethinus]|uniref:Uncharacterized protein LOC111275436 n=1 Tax=Durio zibethinus TaxID=66656 RepID=A0A6P5WM73_DURZI|nr:uncharacterized protein LOC111275436 [Durio zibethinus]
MHTPRLLVITLEMDFYIQSDYLRRISLKMLTMEKQSENTIPNTGNNSKAPDPGSEGMQNQVHSQGQSIPIPLQSNQSQAHQQLLPQSVPNNMSSAGVQSSTGLQSGMPSVSGPTQNSIPNVVGQNSNMQNLSEISQNSLGQGISSNICTNHQRQMQGRQQVLPQQQQHLCLQGSKLPAPDTPGNGMSTSPLLAGFENANDTHSNALTTDFGESKDTEEPHVPRVTMFQAKPMSLKSLEASVVVMVEEAATAVGVDMAVLSKGGLHRRNFLPQTGMTGAEKMRFYMSALAILALMFWFIIIASA